MEKEYEVKKTEVKMVGVELENPFPLGFGVLHQLPRVFYIIEAESNEGDKVSGVGEASIDFPFSNYDAYDVYDALDRLDIEGAKISDRKNLLESKKNREELLSFTPAAFCAFNMALDDVAGRADKKSVLDYYGENRENLRIMSSLGFTEDYDILIRNINSRLEEGLLPKVKLGKTVGEDLATLEILDNELSPRAKFAIDFNAQYSIEESEEFLSVLINEQRFNPKRVVLWEQPTKKIEGIRGLKTFKDFLYRFDPEAIVIADESFVDVEDAIMCAENGIGLNYKIHKIGGLCIAYEIEETLRKRSLLKQNALVGGTFPTAIGRVYDRQAGVSLSSTTLPSDGMEPSSNWFKGPKHFIKEEFLKPNDLGMVAAQKGDGSGVTVDWEKISEFIVNNPREEYRRVRNGLSGEKIKIQLRGNGTYADKYKEMTGKNTEWNL